MKTGAIVATIAVAALSSAVLAQEGGGVSVNNLSKNVTATGGTAQVSAAGSLAPWGGIGIGCGINWEQNKSFGGGLQAGSATFGLGGGYTASPDLLTVGLGMSAFSTKANAQLNLTSAGAPSFEFSSSTDFKCIRKVVNGLYTITCTTTA